MTDLESKQNPKEEKIEERKPVWYDEKPKEWKVFISFIDCLKVQVTSHNSKGKAEVIEGSKNIWEHIQPIIEATNKELLFWDQYKIWVGHEQITKDHIFDDVNYLREPEGWIRFVAEEDIRMKEDKSRQKTVLAQVFEEKKCVVCKQKDTNRILPCLHVCLCEDCFPKLDKCPICRKRKQQF